MTAKEEVNYCIWSKQILILKKQKLLSEKKVEELQNTINQYESKIQELPKNYKHIKEIIKIILKLDDMRKHPMHDPEKIHLALVVDELEDARVPNTVIKSTCSFLYEAGIIKQHDFNYFEVMDRKFLEDFLLKNK